MRTGWSASAGPSSDDDFLLDNVELRADVLLDRAPRALSVTLNGQQFSHATADEHSVAEYVPAAQMVRYGL